MNNDELELTQFAENLRQEVIMAAEAGGENDEGNAFREDEFTRLMIDHLTEAGELEDGHVCHYIARGMKINGYSLHEEDECLNLFTSIYTQQVPPTTIRKDEVTTALKRLIKFVEQAFKGLYQSLEEASCAFDMANLIFSLKGKLNRIRLFVFTDGLTTKQVWQDTVQGDITFSSHIWDMRRLYQCVTSGQRREAIEIDFQERYGATIPCLVSPSTQADYEACLAIVPGAILYKLYDEYGSRLLERNVRSFLQAKGKVNKGIRTTLSDQPQRFLAYNNGISATAEAIRFVDLPGGKAIAWIRDLQIVNGGQTTASIFQAARKDKADLSEVHVQAKITIVDQEKLDEIVPLISRYANSQNKVSDADFSANDPFHVQVEERSRTIWAPAVDGSQKQTRWFYERARGQYLDAKNRLTLAKQKEFAALHPTAQKFTKTDLAKYEHTWNQLPHLVSRGAQKNFNDFTVRLKQRGSFDIDETYFKHLIAKAILFKKAEKLVQAQAFGGYRANIVTYTLAYLSHRTAQMIDLTVLWKEQDVPKVLQDAITLVATAVHQVIIHPPGSGNVTEWCKKEACWETVKKLEVRSEALPHLLLGTGTAGKLGNRGIDELDVAEQQQIHEIASVSADTWFEIARWAKETANLLPWQRSLSVSLGKLASQEKLPSRKQALRGMEILEEVERLGFKTADEVLYRVR